MTCPLQARTRKDRISVYFPAFCDQFAGRNSYVLKVILQRSEIICSRLLPLYTQEERQIYAIPFIQI
jgi:hypothetical protein